MKDAVDQIFDEYHQAIISMNAGGPKPMGGLWALTQAVRETGEAEPYWAAGGVFRRKGKLPPRAILEHWLKVHQERQFDPAYSKEYQETLVGEIVRDLGTLDGMDG